ncbi:MAG: cell division protein FtsL [Candidatus Thiodiazotropha sp. (ex Monitilora ramsayi)]|nr:cell division protein FtsL [Candidatus Thiodiazotropha sp. (ex Monitilora ramsayi)]
MNLTRHWLVGLLLIAVVGSAVSVVYSKYLSRRHFVGLQALQAERERLGVEWGRLQLEESTLATHSEIEKQARGRLQMHLPNVDEVVVIRR